MTTNQNLNQPQTPPRTLFRRIRFHLVGLLSRGLKWSGRLAVGYLLVVLIGLIPVNNDFVSSPDGVEIFVISNAVHTDLVLPVDSKGFSWKDRIGELALAHELPNYSHLAFGWGDQGFYIETPTWSDLRLSTALNALFLPSPTCMHVQLFNPDDLPLNVRKVKISDQEYHRMVTAIQASFTLDADGDWMPIAGAKYGSTDAFFQANGSYHFLNTCNSWAGRVLKAAGVRVGWYTPLPKTIYWYLPESD